MLHHRMGLPVSGAVTLPASHQVMTGPPHKVPSLPGCPRALSVEMLDYPLQQATAVPKVPSWKCHCGIFAAAILWGTGIGASLAGISAWRVFGVIL